MIVSLFYGLIAIIILPNAILGALCFAISAIMMSSWFWQKMAQYAQKTGRAKKIDFNSPTLRVIIGLALFLISLAVAGLTASPLP